MSKFSLKLQLALSAAFLGVTLLLVQSIVQFHSLRGDLTEQIQAQQFSLLTEVAANLDEKLDDRITALRRGATTVPQQSLGNVPALEHHLSEESALLTLFDDLYIFDAKGLLLADWPPKPGRRGLDMSSRDYIQDVQKTLQPTVSRPILGKSTRQPIIVVAAPILDASGKLAGIMGGVLNLYQPNLLATLPSRKIGNSGYFYLVAPDRTMIAHPDKSRILKEVAAPGVNPALDRALQGFEGTLAGVNSQGLEGLFTFKHLKTTDWMLASVVPAEEAFSPIAAIQQRMVLTTLVFIVVTVPLLWIFAHHLVRPLGRFADALRERALNIRAGRPVPSVPASGSDEMRTLAHAFNEFLDARNAAEQAAEHLSWHDTLTGLANRPFFLQQLEKTMGETRRHDSFASVLLVDLDRFKDINEARGLALGDALLKEVAGRLNRELYPEDLLARLDADEFAILMPKLTDNRENAGRAALALAERLHLALREGLELDGEVFHLEASVGIALLPETAQETSDDVLRQADTAMHQAKADGGARTVFFESTMGLEVRQRYHLEQDLRRAAAAGQLRMYLQPQVDEHGAEIGAEALVRWMHPERGLVSPGVFIPLAEMSDLIVTIDRWVLTEVCRLLAQLEERGNAMRISVNISPRHFQRPDFVSEVKQRVAASGADPRRLVLEVTESLLIDNVPDTIAKMAVLSAMGVQFSLDDFGTGYSSLAHLKRLPIHELKIDRSFIQDAPVDPSDAALVDTILAVAQNLRLAVVAEGVETEAQAEFLRGRGAIVRQGYLHGRPMPVADWLARSDVAAAQPV